MYEPLGRVYRVEGPLRGRLFASGSRERRERGVNIHPYGPQLPTSITHGPCAHKKVRIWPKRLKQGLLQGQSIYQLVGYMDALSQLFRVYPKGPSTQ